MSDFLNKKYFIYLFLVSFAQLSAQMDSPIFKKDFFKMNDSITKETITVFNPEIGIDVFFESNKYYLKNNLVEENTSIDGKLNGLSKKYYFTGQLKEIANYVLGSKIGLYCDFYVNGKMKSIGEYTIRHNDSLVHLIKPKVIKYSKENNDDSTAIIVTTEYNQGLKNKKWMYFDNTGKLIKEEFWKEGLLQTSNEK